MTSPKTFGQLPEPTTVPTAGLLLRVAAYLVDQFVIIPLLYGIYYFAVVQPNFYGVVACWLLQFLYKPVTEAYFGGTAGKYLLRMRVVDRLSFRPPSLNQSFIRFIPFAVAYFASLFVIIRALEDPSFAEVSSLKEYVTYTSMFPLQRSFIVSLCNNFPVFSGVWLILDPWSRALHDRWAQTFVIRLMPETAEPT